MRNTILYLIVIFLVGSISLQSCDPNDIPDPPDKESLAISPVPAYMGMVPLDGGKATRSLLLFNTGAETVTISDFIIEGANSGSFKVANSPNMSLGAVESAVIEIEYDPAVASEETAKLTVTSDFGSISNDLYGEGTDGSSEIEFFRILGVLDNETLSHGIETADGGFIFVGSKLIQVPIERTDIQIVKTDRYGATVWEKMFGGQFFDYPAKIIQTSDGGYAIAGTTESFDAINTAMYLIKIDGSGNEQWSNTYGTEKYESSSQIIQTADGGFLLFGTRREFQSDGLIVKTNSTGEKEWEKIYGGDGGEAISDAIPQTGGAGYVFAGRTTSHDPDKKDTDIWLVEIDNSGNILNENHYGKTAYESVNCLIKTSDDGYAMSGVQLSDTKARQALLFKVKDDYSEDWWTTFGNDNNDGLNTIRQLPDGGFIANGWSVREITPEHTYSEAFVLKTDSAGNETKKEVFEASRNVGFSSLENTSDNGFILCGTSNSYSINNAPILMKLTPKF